MWRALFLAIGLYCCLLGVEALAVDKAVIKPSAKAAQRALGRNEVIPPEWAPWSLMSAGAIVVLYSFSIPRRVSG